MGKHKVKRPPSEKQPCTQCGEPVSARGLHAHNRFRHGAGNAEVKLEHGGNPPVSVPAKPKRSHKKKVPQISPQITSEEAATVFEQAGFPNPFPAEKETPAVMEQLVTEQAQQVLNPAAPAPVIPFSMPDLTGETHRSLTAKIEALLDKNGLDREKYSMEELQMLRLYEGHGGLAKKQLAKGEQPELGIMDQFYTPYATIEKMWGLALLHGYNPAQPNRILEPAVGIGRVLEYVPNTPGQVVDAYETSKYAWMICKLTMPAQFNFIHASFETLFFSNNMRMGLGATTVRYHLVIGNPPYRSYKSEFSKVKGINGKTEADETLASTFDQYFLMRGVDVLVPGGLLIYVLPNTFMSNGDSYNDFKELLFTKADLLDAYRLPDVFEHTSIGTDLVVLKKKG